MKEITNKWPAMLITGEKVTEKQAIDIIIRTDEAVVQPLRGIPMSFLGVLAIGLAYAWKRGALGWE